LFTAFAILGFDVFDIWAETMTTLAMVLTAVAFCALVGIPVGIVASRSDRFATFLRPILDIMQTVPAFVYLVPIVMLFGVGLVPGIIATIIFALPPIVRLTNLGIREVSAELVEAGYSFGSTPRQVLWEIQVPLAMRTIMAGLNQTLMLSLSMVVIAALIGAGGLGMTVNTGINTLDVGSAAIGGLGIVLMAIVLDRVTQAFADTRSAKPAPWTFRGVFRALDRLPADLRAARAGDREKRWHIGKMAAGMLVVAVGGYVTLSGGEPGAEAISEAWNRAELNREPRSIFADKRRCTRTPFFEAGYMCTFLARQVTDDGRRIKLVRLARRGGRWQVLEVR
jgi:ABC-type proline/glycine betaine transport system permease subunit